MAAAIANIDNVCALIRTHLKINFAAKVNFEMGSSPTAAAGRIFLRQRRVIYGKSLTDHVG